MFIAFTRQLFWFESASVLRYTYIASLVYLDFSRTTPIEDDQLYLLHVAG
jgi:hypothetical protein